MRILPSVAALASAGALLSLQILGGLEATQGASTYTRASMIVAMCAVALLPVFIHIAWSHRLRALALALSVAFVALLAYSLPAVVGRTGEIKHSQATLGDMSAAVRSDLSQTVQRLDWARGDWLAECRTGNGPSCKGKAQTVAALEARVEKLRGELRTAPAGDLGSEAWAWASMGTVSAETIRKGSVLAFAVGLDVAIWGLVWLATSLLTVRKTQEKVSTGVFRASDLVLPKDVTEKDLEDLRKLLARVGRPLTNNELAGMLKISKGEASKRVSAAVSAAMCERRRIGREVAISYVH